MIAMRVLAGMAILASACRLGFDATGATDAAMLGCPGHDEGEDAHDERSPAAGR